MAKKETLTPDQFARYERNVQAVGLYYGVSNETARYMFHRAKAVEKYGPWTLQLQNAIVKSNELLTPIRWKQVEFGHEVEALKKHGIIVEDMDNDSTLCLKPKITDDNKENSDVKTVDNPTQTNGLDKNEKSVVDDANDDSGWTTVVKKKKRPKKVKHHSILNTLNYRGLFP